MGGAKGRGSTGPGEESTVVTVRVDARISFVSDVGSVRAGVGAAEILVASTVITIRVDTRVDLVGDVGVVGTGIGAAVGTSSSSADVSGFMTGTVVAIRINTRVGLVGNVGAVGSRVTAAATVGGSSSVSHRLGTMSGRAQGRAMAGCVSNMGAMGSAGTNNPRFHSVCAGGHSACGVDGRIQLVDCARLVGSSSGSGSGRATSIVLRGAEMLVVDISVSSTVVWVWLVYKPAEEQGKYFVVHTTVTVNTGVKLVGQVGGMRSMVRGLSRLTRLILLACQGFFGFAYKLHDEKMMIKIC